MPARVDWASIVVVDLGFNGPFNTISGQCVHICIDLYIPVLVCMFIALDKRGIG